MVKHQRRSHQRGLCQHDILDDCTSDSESGDSPSTPKPASIAWPTQGVIPLNQSGITQGHGLQRASSFADFGQHLNYAPQQPHSQHQHHFAQRHSMSSEGVHNMHDLSIHERPLQHSAVHTFHRAVSMPHHPYYVTDHNNPGVATMNTQPMGPQYQIPRQHANRLPLEIPYSGSHITHSIQSSPSDFSAASARSPSAPDSLYTHSSTQASTCAMGNVPSADHQPRHSQHQIAPQQQQPHIIQYPQQHHQSFGGQHRQAPGEGPQQSPQQSQAAPPSQAPQHGQQIHEVTPDYQSPSPQPQPQAQAMSTEEYWTDVPYQAPVEVATIGSLPSFGSGPYDMWGPKIEFEDASMPLPSIRIENL